MTLATHDQIAQLPARADSPTTVEFVPFGASDAIKLSVKIIREYIAVPTRTGDLPDDRACMKFLMLCRAGKLNPFVGDAYLIGWKDRDSNTVQWNLITSVSAFYKRAEVNQEYNGIASGVIVRDSAGNLVDRVGDFTHEGDTLLGGWATVYFRTREHPTMRRVKLATYQKPFGVWKSDPAGMVCKVAEVHALRDSFPTMMGGLYLREEIEASHPAPSNGETKIRALNERLREIPHPTEPTQVIDTSTSNEPDVSGIEAEPPADSTESTDWARLREDDAMVTASQLTGRSASEVESAFRTKLAKPWNKMNGEQRAEIGLKIESGEFFN